MLQLVVDSDLVIHITKWPHVGASLMFSVEDARNFGKFLEECLNEKERVSFPLEFKRLPITKGAQTRRLERITVRKISEDSPQFEVSGGVSFTFSHSELKLLRDEFYQLAKRLYPGNQSKLATLVSFHRDDRNSDEIMSLHFGKTRKISLGVKEFCYFVLSMYESCSSAHAIHVLELSDEQGTLWMEKEFNTFNMKLQEPSSLAFSDFGSRDNYYELVDYLELYAATLREHSLLISEMAKNADITMSIVNAEVERAMSVEGHRGSRVRRLQQIHKSLVQRLHQKKPTRRKELQQVFLAQGSLGVELLSRIIERIWSNSS